LGPAPEPTKISLELGFKNTQNFNSVSFTLGISDYVRDGENLDQGVERVYKYVHRKLQEKLDTVKDGTF
jgi:hypothetical protein